MIAPLSATTHRWDPYHHLRSHSQYLYCHLKFLEVPQLRSECAELQRKREYSSMPESGHTLDLLIMHGGSWLASMQEISDDAMHCQFGSVCIIIYPEMDNLSILLHFTAAATELQCYWIYWIGDIRNALCRKLSFTFFKHPSVGFVMSCNPH